MAPRQQPVATSLGTSAELPDPGSASTLDDIVECLRSLKVWAGAPSYERIAGRVNAAWTVAGRAPGDLVGKTTVVDCFRPGRRRLNTDLVVAIVQALHSDVGYVTQWRQALRVVGGETRAAAQVRVQDRLPPDLSNFTGRTAELDRLTRTLDLMAGDSGPVVISAVAGMPGVGKTQFVIHAAHMLARDSRFERVLFVNLRGFDPSQPPADPAAVLDGFLRLLGAPGQQIPHSLDARVAAYRQRLTSIRTLIVLDNAADENQVRPLLPDTPRCPVLVTSRRSLTDLYDSTHLEMDGFTAAEAQTFLAGAVPHTPVGADSTAPARIAARCGHLPLALGLIAAHIAGTSGWTLTDHADRLDERHHARRVDTGVELALDLSYQHLGADRQRALRLAALHPAQEVDCYSAAALTGRDATAVKAALEQLCRDHLLQAAGPSRYTFHDLVHAYATGRAGDEDSPVDRRAALTRLFDYYLAAAASAMDTLYPAETVLRPRIPTHGLSTPVLTDPDSALTWLRTERPTLVALAEYTATNGWPTYTIRLSIILSRYLLGGYLTDSLTVHGHANDAAQLIGDVTGQAHALKGIGVAHMRLGQYGRAGEQLRRALKLFHEVDDIQGLASAHKNVGNVESRLGNDRQAAEHFHQALTLYRQAGDSSGEAAVLGNLALTEARRGREGPAIDSFGEALDLCRRTGDRDNEAWVLNNLGYTERRAGRYGAAVEHLDQALTLFRHLGNRSGEAWVLNSIGELYTSLGQPDEAADHYRQALTIFVETSDREGEVGVLNDLGEALLSTDRAADALKYHAAALDAATAIGDRLQQARAQRGLGHARRRLKHLSRARQHYERAWLLYSELGMPEADEIHARLSLIEVTAASARN